jgi:hypothetical protein
MKYLLSIIFIFVFSFVAYGQSNCTYSFNTNVSSSSEGENAYIDVFTQTGCTWASATEAVWITITSGAAGSGNGRVSFTTAKNETFQSRSANFTVAGSVFNIYQNAAPQTPCTYNITSPSLSFPASGAPYVFTVETQEGCRWTYPEFQTLPSWISNGNVLPNGGPARSFQGVFRGFGRFSQPHSYRIYLSISQASGCTYNAIVPSFVIPASGGTSAVSKYISNPACGSATEISNDSWLVIDRPGTPTSYITAAPNTGPPRTGTVTVNFSNGDIRILAFNQAGTCSFQISQSSQDFTSAGGTGTVTVSGQTGCPYASLNELSYLTLDSGAEGSGSGTVTFTVSPNSGTARTGTIFIAGQDFRINQAAGKSRKRVRFF